jgi:hypothetical protein
VFEGNADAKALIITATLQGVLQIARTAGSKVVFAALRQLRVDLGL